MKITQSLAFALAVVATATLARGGQICTDGTPQPTPTVEPTTPAPTTPTPTTPAPTTPTSTTPTPTTPEPTTPAPTTPTPTTPAPTTPAPTTPANCGVINKDTAFNNLRYVTVNGAAAPACCDLCSNAPGCRAMMHVTSQNRCFLFYYTGAYTAVPLEDYSSSLMNAPKPMPPLLSGTRLVGHTYSASEVPIVEGCAVQCSVGGSKCKGFTYSTPVCALLDSIDHQEADERSTSALL